jgi:hypothetical protein
MYKPPTKQRKNAFSIDLGNINLNSYNDAAGSMKISNVGHKLNPIKISDTSYTTDASTRRKVGKGVTIAIYNNIGAPATVATITVGDVTVANGAAGAVQVSGINYFVTIPCQPNTWTYINTYDFDYIITDAATTLCFVVEDDSYINIR